MTVWLHNFNQLGSRVVLLDLLLVITLANSANKLADTNHIDTHLFTHPPTRSSARLDNNNLKLWVDVKLEAVFDPVGCTGRVVASMQLCVCVCVFMSE